MEKRRMTKKSSRAKELHRTKALHRTGTSDRAVAQTRVGMKRKKKNAQGNISGCRVVGCVKPVLALGLCVSHYKIFSRCGKIRDPLFIRHIAGKCHICGKKGPGTLCREHALEKLRINSDNYRNGGKRGLLIKKYGNKCILCDMTNEESIINYNGSLQIHHLDRTGRGCSYHNHDVDNLVLICKGCHGSISILDSSVWRNKNLDFRGRMSLKVEEYLRSRIRQRGGEQNTVILMETKNEKQR
jgi:hypothetical protein